MHAGVIPVVQVYHAYKILLLQVDSSLEKFKAFAKKMCKIFQTLKSVQSSH